MQPPVRLTPELDGHGRLPTEGFLVSGSCFPSHYSQDRGRTPRAREHTANLKEADVNIAHN